MKINVTKEGQRKMDNFPAKFVASSEIDWSKEGSMAYGLHNHVFLNANLLGMGSLMFSKAMRISKIDEFRSLLDRQPDEQSMEFALESTVDKFRIVTCFDNYCKAMLLEKGYLVHCIKNSGQYRELKSAQENRPIKVEEVTIIEDFVQKIDKPQFAKLPGITNHTLSISTLLSDEYQKIIGLPPEIVATLKDFVNYRNMHHFYVAEAFAMNSQIIFENDKLNSYVNDVIEIKKSEYIARVNKIKEEQKENGI